MPEKADEKTGLDESSSYFEAKSSSDDTKVDFYAITRAVKTPYFVCSGRRCPVSTPVRAIQLFVQRNGATL